MFAMILRTEHTSQPGTEFSQDCLLSTRGPTIPTTRHITTAQVTTSDSSLDPIIRPISSFHLKKNPQSPWPQTQSPTRVSFENLNGPYSWPPLFGIILRMDPEKVAKRPTGIDRSV